MRDVKFVLADVETTGVKPTDKIVEIGWMELSPDLEIISEFESLVDPCMPIPASASGVHHIVDKDVADSPTIEELFAPESGIFSTHPFIGDIVLIAHNERFDRRFLREHFENHIGSICTLRLAKRFITESPDHKLATLSYFLDLEKGTGHRALGDVFTTLQLLKWLSNHLSLNLPELLEECKQLFPIEKMPFGKHKGQKIETLPLQYINWVLNNVENLDPDLGGTLKARIEAVAAAK